MMMTDENGLNIVVVIDQSTFGVDVTQNSLSRFTKIDSIFNRLIHMQILQWWVINLQTDFDSKTRSQDPDSSSPWSRVSATIFRDLASLTGLSFVLAYVAIHRSFQLLFFLLYNLSSAALAWPSESRVRRGERDRLLAECWLCCVAIANITRFQEKPADGRGRLACLLGVYLHMLIGAELELSVIAA